MSRFGDTRYRTGILLLMLLGVGLTLGQVSYADPPEGKGRPEDPGQQGNREGQGRGREEAAAARTERAEAKADNRADRAESRSGNAAEARVERQQDRRSQERADRDTSLQNDHRSERATDHRRDSADHGREAARQRVASLADSLTKLEHARWSYNPHDTRGQGNMGQPRMRDPYGFDKDSGREGRDRGRPIRESEEPTEPPVIEEPLAPTLNLAELVTADLSDPYLSLLYEAIAYAEEWVAWAEANPELASMYSWWVSYISYMLTYYQNQLTQYLASPPETYQAVLVWGDTVDYSLTFQPFEGMEGSTFIVTTQLVSTETVSLTGVSSSWEATTFNFEEGQVLAEQTQEVTLTQDGTYTLSLDPSAILGGYFNGSQGVTADVVVTITDPATGASYTMTLDNQIRLVDPYGIVYNKTTGRPIAGATVTVHKADGSIVQLDASGNSNVSNPQMTDATGRYNCKLPAGKYYLTVKAPGYEDYKSPMFSELGHIVREDVGLTPLATEATLPSSPTLQTPAPVGSGLPPVSPAALPVK